MWKNKRFKELKKRVRDKTQRGLLNAADSIKTDILQEVPHDEGTLEGTVGVFVNPNNKMEVAVSAGGGNGTGMPMVPYAIRWHEDPANFQKGRKHNYVRDPVKRAESDQRALISIAKELQSL